MFTAAVLFAIEVLAAVILMRYAKARSSTLLAGSCVFVVSLAAACSVCLALQAVIMHTAGFLEDFPLWPILGWIAVGLIGFAFASISRLPSRLVSAPCWLLGTTSLAYSLFYRQILGLVIVLPMFMAALTVMYGLRTRPES